MESITGTHQSKVLMTLAAVALALGFASSYSVPAMAGEAAQQEGAAAGEAAHTCPHAKAAAGEAAAPCEHAADGSCSKCGGEKDCPHAKGESCEGCADKNAAPKTH